MTCQTVEADISGIKVSIETGRMAKQANGAVFDPVRDEMFTAVRGRVSDEKLRVIYNFVDFARLCVAKSTKSAVIRRSRAGLGESHHW